MKHEKLDLKDLVELARSGDREAFGGLIQATQNRLFRFCLTLCGDRTLAEDLCQEAYLKAFDRLSSLNDSGAFFDWLFRITKNLYLDLVRSPSMSRTSSLEDEGSGEILGSDPGDLAEALNVHQALSQFEPEDRWLILLVDLEERTYKEAAEIIGISEDAVRSRLFRLRQIFLKNLESLETK